MSWFYRIPYMLKYSQLSISQIRSPSQTADLSNLIFWSQEIYHISSVIRLSFSFQNNPKDLDPSSKTDLDLLDCLGRVKLVL